MAEMVVFAVVLGVVLVLSSLVSMAITMALFTSPRFLKAYTKRVVDAMNALTNADANN